MSHLDASRIRVLLSAFLIMLMTWLCAGAPARAGDDKRRNLIFILDASGSMWTRLGDRPRIEIAKEVMTTLVNDLPDNTNVGLIAYGHRKKDDCKDVEMILPMGPLDRNRMTVEIMSLNPRGRTPITFSILRAVETLKTLKEECTIVLVTDGKETCEGDPCELVRKLKKIGVNFIMHVIGFDVSKKDKAPLECIARAGDGSYYTAKNAGDFLSALKKATRPKPEVKVATEPLCVGAVKNARWLIIKIIILKGDRVVITGDNSTKNPQEFYLEPGLYTIRATDASSKGTLTQTAAAEFKGKKMVKIFNFSHGHLQVMAVKDGLPVTAFFYIKRSGTEERLAAGDTSEFNPQTIQLVPGIYDMVANNPEQAGRPPIFFSGIRIEGGKTLEKTLDFSEGVLQISLLVNGTPSKGNIKVLKAGTDEQVLSRDTSSENPVLMKLMPGQYDIVAEIEAEDKKRIIEKKDIAVTLKQRVSLEFSF